MTFYKVFLAAWVALVAHDAIAFATELMVGEPSTQPVQECAVKQ